MIEVNIVADSKYKFDRGAVRARISDVLQRFRIKDKVEVTLQVVGRRKITQLNETYLKHEGVTDVLSFPLNDPTDDRAFISSPDGVLHLGEIVVCYPVAIDEAVERQVSLDMQIMDLFEHGLMHLLGFHHE